MSVAFRFNKSQAQILAERGLNGKAELFLANEVQRTTDKYVPMKSGTLKNTARIVQNANGTELRYITPYAKKQYYHGRSPGSSAYGALRGKMWFERSKADNKQAWIQSVKSYCGGNAK